MTTMLWLAWREMTARRGALIATVLMVTALTGFAAGIELLCRARDSAVAARLDSMGPGLHFVAKGRSAADITHLRTGTGSISEAVASAIASDLSWAVRRVEARLVRRVAIDGAELPAIGIPSMAPGKVAFGSLLGTSAGRRPGTLVDVANRPMNLEVSRPPAGSAEDAAVFLALADLQNLTGNEGAINEVRIFLRAGVDPEAVVSKLAERYPDASVVSITQGAVAATELPSALRDARWALQIVSALAILGCLLVSSHLNGLERRGELALLASTGVSSMRLSLLIAARAAILGTIGGATGYVIGAVFALIQDFAAASDALRSLPMAGTLVAGTVVAAVVGALPVSIHSALREHVRELQA